MIRPVRPDGRIDAGGAFSPIYRPRVVERIATAALQRVVLLVAPAGYGKSTALRQYLEGLDAPYVRYDVHADNSTLLGFIRGFADAIYPIAPDARATVSGAYASAQLSPTAAEDLAMWMHAHVKTYAGLIAIDDLHVAAEGDENVALFLASLIDRTHGRTRWMLASRSYLNLPIGTWTAYQEMDLAVDEADLAFTTEEAREAARGARVSVRDEELHDLLELTGGWPTALSFALRSSTRSLDLRNVQATTRELAYRYLAEQVYRTLDDEEREILALAALLPEIDLRVLQAAGYDHALPRIEDLRQRVAFIVPDRARPGVYLCHDLFRDFVRHQIALEGSDAIAKAYAKSARALELSGDLSGSLFLYARARDVPSILRILDACGFPLFEEGHGDAIAAALDALDTRVRGEEPMALALRGLTEAGAGRYDHAVALLRRAAKCAKNAEMRSQITLCAARIAINTVGPDPAQMLDEVENEGGAADDTRGEASSMLAVYHARGKRRTASESAIERAVQTIDRTDAPQVRARIMQRVGLALLEIGSLEKAREYSARSAELSTECGLLSLASRALSSLNVVSNMMGAEPTETQWFAQQELTMATRSGDALNMQIAFSHLLSSEVRRGDVERVAALERQLLAIHTTDPSHDVYALTARAWRHSWSGNFAEAYRLLDTMWQNVSWEWVKMQNGSVCAVCAAAAGKTEAAGEIVSAVLRLADDAKTTPGLGPTTRNTPILFCALAHAISGRFTMARQLTKRISRTEDVKVAALREAVEAAMRLLKHNQESQNMADGALRQLRSMGYVGHAMLIEAVMRVCRDKNSSEPSDRILTPSELAILRMLADGATAKEIAIETGRSLYTVQAHIQNTIEKLHCHGRYEAVSVARERGILRG